MSNELKAKVMAMLCMLGILPRNFTGNLTINFNAGAVCDIWRNERLK